MTQGDDRAVGRSARRHGRRPGAAVPRRPRPPVPGGRRGRAGGIWENRVVAVTIKDVARRAGVSQSTVCRAMANPELVRASTRERVLRAVAELGYFPNRAAQALTTGRTATIGLVVPDLANPFYPGVVKAVQARAREFDHAVLLADTDEDPAAEAELIRRLAKQVDGFLLCSPRAPDEELRAFAAETPLVVLNRRVGPIPAILCDNVDGMRQAVAHLHALGHRRVAYVAGPCTSWANRERTRGLRTAAAALGVEVVEIGHTAPTFEGGAAAADLVLAASVTAVIAYNDLQALGLLSRFGERGAEVPGRISVVGCDDIPAAALVTPRLTTVTQGKEQAGRAAVDLLLEILQGRQGPTGPRRVMPAQLIVRGSTGPAPDA